MQTQLKQILDKEIKRQHETLGLIPSENYTSKAVREAVGSVFMHKYSEGYPASRYYEGNENVDELENLAMELAKKVFKLPENWGVNVQPLAGSNANLAVYNALLKPNEKILSMYLPDGGHLSHGWSYTPKQTTGTEVVAKQELKETTTVKEGDAKLKVEVTETETVKVSAEDTYEKMIYRGGDNKVNIVSKFFNVVQYKTNPETLLFDYDFIEKLAIAEKPKIIITGGTAYPRNIDYLRIKEIAQKVGAIYLADVAHEAGLIAAGVVDSPVGYADIVTLTTHKTLRGPKGAMIFAREEYMDLINKSIMPGMQGGPHNGTIAGITQCLFEANTDAFKLYAKQIIINAKTLADELINLGYKLVSDGTDKHLILIDLRNKKITGRQASFALAAANIITNKNTIPYDSGSPVNPNGLRIGTPTVTTRGMKENEMKLIALLIDEVVNESLKYTQLTFDEFKQEISKNEVIKNIKSQVLDLCNKYTFID